MRAKVGLVALVLGCAGCGGAASHGALPLAIGAPAGALPSGGAQAPGIARFSLTIPNTPAAAGALRRPAYVSSSTLSGTLQVNSGALVQLNLGSGNPNCTAVAGGRACTITASAPVGSDTFALVLYDGPYTGGVHTGSPLSAASSFTATVAEGSANVTTPLVLGGIPAKVDVAASGLVARTPGTVPLIVTAYDVDGNTIVGPGTYTDASGNAAPLTLASAIATSQLTLHDGAQSGSSVTVAGPTDSLTLQLSGAADILGVPFTITNAAAIRLPARTSQIVAINGTLHAMLLGATILNMPDYTFYAPMDTTLAAGVPNGFIFDFGSQSDGGDLGYFDSSTETLHDCTVPVTTADAAVTPVDSGIAYAYSASLFADTNPWGLSYLPLTAFVGGSCGTGTTYETDTLGTPDSVGRALVYDKTAHQIFEGGDNAYVQPVGPTVFPSLRSYGFSSGTISGGTIIANPYTSYPNSLVTVDGLRFFELGGNVIYTQSGATVPSASSTIGSAAITSLSIGYDQRVYALDSSGQTVYAWDGSTTPTRYTAGTFSGVPGTAPWQLAAGPDGAMYADNGVLTAEQLRTTGSASTVTLQTSDGGGNTSAVFDGHNGYVYAIINDALHTGYYYIDRISN